MVEKLHQLDKCQFCIVAVHVVELFAKALRREWPLKGLMCKRCLALISLRIMFVLCTVKRENVAEDEG